MKNYSFLLCLLFALIIRLGLSIYSSPSIFEHKDSFLHRDWGRVAFLHGFADTYSDINISNVGNPNNLPPGATYLFGSMYSLSIFVSKVVFFILDRQPGTFLWMNDGSFANVFMRIPAIFADLSIGVLIYFFAKVKSNKHGIVASALYLFNPISIYNSSVWGQFDAVPVALFLSSIFSLTKRHYFLSTFFATLSLFIKLSLLPLFPLYGFILFFQAGWKKTILYSIAMIVIILLMILPISRDPIQWLLWFINNNSTGVLDSVTASAYNFWWMLLVPRLFVETETVFSQFMGLNFYIWGFILYGIFLPIHLFLSKKYSMHCNKSLIHLCRAAESLKVARLVQIQRIEQ